MGNARSKPVPKPDFIKYRDEIVKYFKGGPSPQKLTQGELTAMAHAFIANPERDRSVQPDLANELLQRVLQDSRNTNLTVARNAQQNAAGSIALNWDAARNAQQNAAISIAAKWDAALATAAPKAAPNAAPNAAPKAATTAAFKAANLPKRSTTHVAVDGGARPRAQ